MATPDSSPLRQTIADALRAATRSEPAAPFTRSWYEATADAVLEALCAQVARDVDLPMLLAYEAGEQDGRAVAGRVVEAARHVADRTRYSHRDLRAALDAYDQETTDGR